VDINKTIRDAFKKGIVESQFAEIVSFNWESVWLAYDSSLLDGGKRFSISLVMYPECTYQAINSEFHEYKEDIIKESLTFKELRNKIDFQKLENILAKLKPMPLFSLTLTCDSKNWADIQKFLQQSILEKEPLFRMPSKSKIAKLYLIQELLASILELSNAQYRQIILLLDNEDFSSNDLDTKYSKSSIRSFISKKFLIHPFFISIRFKKEFRDDANKIALLLLPDLLAGSVGTLIPHGLNTKTGKEEVIESWLLSQRSSLSAIHLTGQIMFKKDTTTISLHSWA
jgi:hypothetical protein